MNIGNQSSDDKKIGMKKIDDNTNSICSDETVMAVIKQMIIQMQYAMMKKKWHE